MSANPGFECSLAHSLQWIDEILTSFWTTIFWGARFMKHQVLSSSIIHKKKSETLVYHHVEGYQDRPTWARVNGGVKRHTNFWTPCSSLNPLTKFGHHCLWTKAPKSTGQKFSLHWIAPQGLPAASCHWCSDEIEKVRYSRLTLEIDYGRLTCSEWGRSFSCKSIHRNRMYSGKGSRGFCFTVMQDIDRTNLMLFARLSLICLPLS